MELLDDNIKQDGIEEQIVQITNWWEKRRLLYNGLVLVIWSYVNLLDIYYPEVGLKSQVVEMNYSNRIDTILASLLFYNFCYFIGAGMNSAIYYKSNYNSRNISWFLFAFGLLVTFCISQNYY